MVALRYISLWARQGGLPKAQFPSKRLERLFKGQRLAVIHVASGSHGASAGHQPPVKK